MSLHIVSAPPTVLCVSFPLCRSSFVSQCSASVPVPRSLYEWPPSVTSIDFSGNAEKSNGFVLLSAFILLLPVCLDADESTHTEETECDHCHSNCWTDKATCPNLWLKVTCSHLIKSYCFGWLLISKWCAVKSCTSIKNPMQCIWLFLWGSVKLVFSFQTAENWCCLKQMHQPQCTSVIDSGCLLERARLQPHGMGQTI